MSVSLITSPLQPGKTGTVMYETRTAAGTHTYEFAIDSDSVLISVWADSVAGDLDIVVYTKTEDGKEATIITFPTLTAATTELLLKKAAVSMARVKVVATFTDACTFEVRAKAIGVGETSVRLLGANDGRASQTTVSTSAVPLVSSSLTDRAGIVIKNNSGSGILYVGYTAAEATAGNGYPIGPGEAVAIDLAAGSAIYGVGDTSIDVRIMEASS